LCSFLNQRLPPPRGVDIIDDALFKSLTAAGLKDADARHLMYAACNGCDRFVTVDPDFTDRKPQLEALCPDLKIVTPSELAAVLSMPSPPEVRDANPRTQRVRREQPKR
jgi:hypothetical protein